MSSAQSSKLPETRKRLLSRATALQLGLAWSVVGIFRFWGEASLAASLSPVLAIGAFLLLFGTIVMSAFLVVHEADHLAQHLGEPYGTLILTLSIVSIEVILIAAVMLGPGEFPTIGRDAIFSVMMIILNLVMGLCILLGGLRFDEQEYNAQGAIAYLSMTTLLVGIALILPNFTGIGGSLAAAQAASFSVLTVLIYGAFLAMQMGRYRRLFVQPPAGQLCIPHGSNGQTSADGTPEPRQLIDWRMISGRSLLLLVAVLPIVLLSHDLAILIDAGIAAAKAPPALGGVLIAIIVFTPESLTAVRAALANEMQRAVNLCLGAFVSTVGLTVPAVLTIGLITGKTVVMGISPINMALLALSLLVSTLTFLGQRTSPIQGMVHLLLFAVFGVLLMTA